MRALLQRVSRAKVDVGGATVGEIGAGLVVLLCAMPTDTEETARSLAGKVTRLRIFPDSNGRMNHSLADAHGAALVISQFTLAADTRRGNRPGFAGAADPELARQLCDVFAAELQKLGLPVATGRFGAHMEISLTNDGPVTIWLDTEAPT